MIHAFPFQDGYLVLDVESGALHGLDKQAYDVVRALETGADPMSLDYPQDEIREILAELDSLRTAGSFDSAPLTPPPPAKDTAVKSMCLHIAHDCNLRCKYCFASTGDYCGGRMLMSKEVAHKSLDFLMEHSKNRKHLEVDLFGGEPLMNFEVVKETVAYGRELEKRFNKQINFTITTNCVALNDEIIDFINEEMFNVVISLDGRKDIHDALRPTPNGKGSFDIIAPKAQKLVAGRGDKEYYARGTFTNRNLDFTEDVKALYELGFDQISVEPVVLDPSSPYAILEEHIGRILEEYDRLADYVLHSRKEGKWFNFFHFMVDLDSAPCLRKRITGCGAGNEYVAVTPDGDIYPCHQFVGEKDFLMGSVMTGEFDQTIQKQFAECNVCTKEVCQECWAKYFCSGGCAANAYKYNGSIYKPHTISCTLMQKRTECALGIYAVEHENN